MPNILPKTIAARKAKARSAQYAARRPLFELNVSKRSALIIAAGFVVVLTIGIGIYVWLSHKSAAASGEAELKSVKAKVSKLYLLPDDETPALATITDTTKLTTPLFKGTKNGDKVLIYQKNRIAVVYRPSLNRVVSVGPVAIDNPKVDSQTNQDPGQQ